MSQPLFLSLDVHISLPLTFNSPSLPALLSSSFLSLHLLFPPSRFYPVRQTCRGCVSCEAGGAAAVGVLKSAELVYTLFPSELSPRAHLHHE